MNISFIGYGNMAKAIAHRLITKGSYSLSAASPSLSIGVTKEKVQTHYDNKEIIKQADVIILAVKPAQMDVVLDEINPLLPANCLLISVAAGLTLDWFVKRCKPQQALIRTMPNTPASIGLAATPMLANPYTSEAQKKQAEHIFSAIGIVTWVEQEGDMDTYTALSGSGPAYVFSFLEAMVAAGIALGLQKTEAERFSLQTFVGAITLAQQSDLSVAELRAKVTSPGGTTAAALNVLHQPLNELVLRAIKAARDRASELG